MDTVRSMHHWSRALQPGGPKRKTKKEAITAKKLPITDLSSHTSLCLITLALLEAVVIVLSFDLHAYIWICVHIPPCKKRHKNNGWTFKVRNKTLCNILMFTYWQCVTCHNQKLAAAIHNWLWSWALCLTILFSSADVWVTLTETFHLVTTLASDAIAEVIHPGLNLYISLRWEVKHVNSNCLLKLLWSYFLIFSIMHQLTLTHNSNLHPLTYSKLRWQWWP